MTKTAALHSLLRRQDGLVGHDQLLALGWTPPAITRRLAAGDWERVHPRVFRAVDHPWTSRARLRALGLWLPPTGTLVGRTAAAWWGLDDPPPVLAAAVPPTGRSTAPRGVVLSRRALDGGDRVRVDGLWVTGRPLTVLEASAAQGLLDGARLMDRALLRRKVSLADLQAAFDRTAGRAGTTRARRLLDLAAGGARSEAERKAVAGLRRAGIGGWTANLEVDLPGWGRVVIDIAFAALRLAIEIDGWAYHRDLRQFRRDRQRQNEIIIGGWRILRFTWYDLVENLAGVVDSIRRAMAAV